MWGASPKTTTQERSNHIGFPTTDGVVEVSRWGDLSCNSGREVAVKYALPRGNWVGTDSCSLTRFTFYRRTYYRHTTTTVCMADTELPDKTFDELEAEDLRGTEYDDIMQAADEQGTSMTELIMDEIDEKQRLMEYAALSVALGRLAGENDITIAEYDMLCEKIIDGNAYGDVHL